MNQTEGTTRGAATLHLVVKRGHHGRFRFVMISDGERIGGEIHVGEPQTDRSGLRALALDRIAQLAEALRVSVTTARTSDASTQISSVVSGQRGRTIVEGRQIG